LDLPEKVAQADRLEKEIPNCKKVVIEGVAHMLNMERVGVFNAAVLDFLSGIG
jgi:pimeloyl-ACP methyl ester carboxylesterase